MFNREGLVTLTTTKRGEHYYNDEVCAVKFPLNAPKFNRYATLDCAFFIIRHVLFA